MSEEVSKLFYVCVVLNKNGYDIDVIKLSIVRNDDNGYYFKAENTGVFRNYVKFNEIDVVNSGRYNEISGEHTEIKYYVYCKEDDIELAKYNIYNSFVEFFKGIGEVYNSLLTQFKKVDKIPEEKIAALKEKKAKEEPEPKKQVINNPEPEKKIKKSEQKTAETKQKVKKATNSLF